MDVIRLDCVNHPRRDGVGRCVTCKQTICGECSSRLQNILYCQACLSRQAATLVRRESPVLGWLLATFLALGIGAWGVSHLTWLAGFSRGVFAEYKHWSSHGAE